MESILLAFQGIWSHKLRSFLTMLGIIIGIASIITIVSTIKGTNEQIKESLVGAGNNAVVVQLYQDNYPYGMEYGAPPQGVYPVTEESRQKLLEIDHVKDVSVYCARSYVNGVFYGNYTYNGAIRGIDEHYFSVNGISLGNGRGFLPDDFRAKRKVCLLDDKACSALYSGKNPVGTTLEIMGESFIVIGTVERSTSASLEIKTVSDYYRFADTSGGTIYIPLDTWPVIFRFDEPNTVALQADSTDNMTSVGQKAAEILTDSQLIGAAQNLTYRGQDLMEQAEKLQELSNSSNRQLIWIASISLLVGGIGVMNIMLVTVTERTQEIGLKKAIGARKKRILWQFLTEAAVLTSLGGMLGIAAGIVMARMISSVMGTPTAISLPAVLIAVVFSMVIGIIFGLLPAVKAANLNPIEALRRE